MNLSSREIVFLTSKSRPVFSIAKTNLFLLANLLMVVCCGVIFQHQAIFGSIVLESLIFLTTLAWTSLQGSSIGEILSLRLPSIPSLKAVGVTLIVVAAGIYVASFLDQLSRFCLQNRVPFPEVEISTPQSIPQYLWVLFALAAMPAIAEEALFRGFILKSYRTYLSTGKAVFISSLFFSMAHLSINNFWTPFILGVIYGWLVSSFDSIFLGVLGHLLNNGLALTLLYLIPNFGRQRLVTLNDLIIQFPPFVIAGLMILMLILRYKPGIERGAEKPGRLGAVLCHWSTWLLFMVFAFFAVISLAGLRFN